MLMGDRKRDLAAIMGPRKDEGADEKSALSMCVEELISAIHSKDVEAATGALKSCFAELSNQEEEPTEEVG